MKPLPSVTFRQLSDSPCTFTTLGRAAAITSSDETTGVGVGEVDRSRASRCRVSPIPLQPAARIAKATIAAATYTRFTDATPLTRRRVADLHQHLADVSPGEESVESVDAGLETVVDRLPVRQQALLLPPAQRSEGLLEATPFVERVKPLHRRGLRQQVHVVGGSRVVAGQ